MSAYSLDLREKIVESVKKGVPKAETARRFGIDRATVKRYCRQLDERGTLEPGKAPGKRPKLDQKARRPGGSSWKTSKSVPGPPTPRGPSSFLPCRGFR
jgi:transposase